MINTSMRSIYLGAIFFISSYFLLALEGGVIKLLSPTIPLSIIIFFQSVVCVALTLPKIMKEGIKHLHTKRLGLHLARDLLGSAWFVVFFLSLKYTSLTTATLLSNTVPLWLPFISLVWFGHKVRKDLWLGIMIGFLGIIFILKPDGESFINIGSILALASGILAACTLQIMRELAATEPNTRVIFYYFSVMGLITLPFAIKNWIPLSLYQWAILLSIGAVIWVQQYLVNLAFKYAKATTLAPLIYSNVAFAAILDWMVWKHVPNALTYAGILLVVVGGVVTLLKERKRVLAVEIESMSSLTKEVVAND